MEPDHGSTEQEADREQLDAFTADLTAPDAAKRLKAVESLGELPIGDVGALNARGCRAARDPKVEVRVAA